MKEGLNGHMLRNAAIGSAVAWGVIALGIGYARAAPLTLQADGLTYTLTETSIAGHTANFDLHITGINAPNPGGDAEGGRSGINAVAFYLPAGGLTSASMTAPPGFNFFNDTGLNSSGCHGMDSAWFCFANSATPPSTPPLAANSSLDLVFSETTPGAFPTNYATDLKIDWVGSKNNYDLTSRPIPINTTTGGCTSNCNVPEPSSLALLGGAGVMLAGLGLLRRHRA